MEEVKKCRYAGKMEGGDCAALKDVKCDGYHPECGFYKTEQQFVDESDQSILTNRKRGNCEKCKYREMKCMTTQEIKEKRERRYM